MSWLVGGVLVVFVVLVVALAGGLWAMFIVSGRVDDDMERMRRERCKH